MVNELVRNWWVLAVRGVLAILLGLAAFFWPGLTLAVLILMFGVYVFVDGIFAIISGISLRKELKNWWLLIIEGIIGIILGIMTFFYPVAATLVLLLFIASWSIVVGVIRITTAIQIRKTIDNEWLMVFSGVLSIIFGLLLLMAPGFGSFAVIWLVATYAVIYGILALVLAFKVRKLDGAAMGDVNDVM